jgi:DNA polymerase III epsilon subunit-like protein
MNYGKTYDEIAKLATGFATDDIKQKLRYLVPIDWLMPEEQDECLEHQGIVFDIETTGFDENAELLSIGWSNFSFDDDMSEARYHGTSIVYAKPPKAGISDEISSLTGLTVEFLDEYGIDIDDTVLDRIFGENPALIVAHFAEFDVNFLRRMYDIDKFEAVLACSVKDIDWVGLYQVRSSSLGNLMAYKYGAYIEHHRADADAQAACFITIEHLKILATTAAERQLTANIYAHGSKFKDKELLKARGYRWVDACWTKFDVPAGSIDEEIDFAKSIAPESTVVTNRDELALGNF